MKRLFGSLLLILITLTLMAGVVEGQSPVPSAATLTPAPTVAPTPVPSPTPTPAPSVEERLDDIEGGLSVLQADFNAESTDWVALVLGLAGILSTLIIGGVGLYFIHKTRASSYREELYSRQIEFLLELSEAIADVKSAVSGVRAASTEVERADARRELQRRGTAFLGFFARASVILPVELFVAFGQLQRSTLDFLLASTEETKIESAFHSLAGHDARFAMLAREFIGTDALSKQSLKIFPRRDWKRALETSVDHYIKMSQRQFDSHSRKS